MDFADLFHGIDTRSSQTRFLDEITLENLFGLARTLVSAHGMLANIYEIHHDTFRKDRVSATQWATFINCFNSAEVCLSGILFVFQPRCSSGASRSDSFSVGRKIFSQQGRRTLVPHSRFHFQVSRTFQNDFVFTATRYLPNMQYLIPRTPL